MEKHIVEINGVKLEVDLSTARVIENYKVGDNVKVLIKAGYSNEYTSYAGVIVGFDNFKSLPTIVIAYLKNDGYDAKIQFAYLNAQTKDCEICPMTNNEIPFNKARTLDILNTDIQKKEEELQSARLKKEYFLATFAHAFSKVLSEQTEEA